MVRRAAVIAVLSLAVACSNDSDMQAPKSVRIVPDLTGYNTIRLDAGDSRTPSAPYGTFSYIVVDGAISWYMFASHLLPARAYRVVLTAELSGGANDYEAFYCPTVEWDWGDGTESESTADCEPYEPGKSEIKRRFTVEHVFKAGNHRITFRLKRHDKPLTAASVQIQVQPGIRDIGGDPR